MLYETKPHQMTIYRWLMRYSQKAVKLLNSTPITVGSTWIADETMIRLEGIGGLIKWSWDVIDNKTRFLLAFNIAEYRTNEDAAVLIKRAAIRANKLPSSIITHKLSTYLNGIELASDSDTKHIQVKKVKPGPNNQIIQNFHLTLKDRAKVVRAFFHNNTINKIMDGWLIHYNFFRPHSALNGKTPAEAAEARVRFRTWADVVKEKED